jgi:hypothetical protein
MNSVFLKLVRLVSWPNICSILENVPCALEKNVCAVMEYSVYVLKVHLVYSVTHVCCFLLILCLDDLPSVEGGVVKAANIIALQSMSPFKTIYICFLYLSVPMLGAYIFTIVYFE